MMLMGENSRVVVDRVKEKMAQVEDTLPPKASSIDTYYDRTELIRRTIRTVAKNLTEGWPAGRSSCCCSCSGTSGAV